MKRKIATYSSLFLLGISLILGAAFGVAHIEQHQSNILNSTTESSKRTVISVEDENIYLNVGEEYRFDDKFKLYVTEEDKSNLTYSIEDEEIVYLTNNKYKFIGLKAGKSIIEISSDKYYQKLVINVKDKNYAPDGNFESFTAGTKWTDKNAQNKGWSAWWGAGNSSVTEGQLIEAIEDNGSNVIHIKHDKPTIQTVFNKAYPVQPGQYYVTVDMKGKDLTKDVYVRVNNNGKDATSTEKVKGTFDWANYSSPIFNIPAGQATTKIELYMTQTDGEAWFDNIELHRVITADYNSFTVKEPVVKLAKGESEVIITETFPEKDVDFNYTFESENESIAKVSKSGNIVAVANGVTNIKVTDELHHNTVNVLVIVGIKDGIHAQFNQGDMITVTEDSLNEFEVSVSDSTNYQIYKFSEPKYGNYYIKDNKINYSPKADYYNAALLNDSFDVLVFDVEKGYTIVTIKVDVKGVSDTPDYIDFWLTTDKNTKLEWSNNGTTNYSSNGLRGGGYLQVFASDIEALYPMQFEGKMEINGKLNSSEYKKLKGALYSKEISAKAEDGSFEITTEHGGKVTIINDGKAQEILDRYYAIQKKVIYGVLYNYTPKDGFFGYDHFNLVVSSGDKSITVNCTVYVAPGVEDYKFDKINLDGTYILGNDEWINEVKEAYHNGDEVIKTWVDYYIAQNSRNTPSGIPAKARTPMEQCAILYKITGDKQYFDKAWAEMLPIVKDEAFSGDGTRRLSWGEDSNGFLDAAMVTYSVALSYNFIKDQLSDAQKEMVMKALYEEGFYFFETIQNPNVLLHGNNHNLLVCGNLAIAALSAMSYDGEIVVNVRSLKNVTVNVREMAAKTVSTAFKYLQIGLVHYSKSGGFPEGPAYSIYAHRNMVGLLATLRNLYGEDENGNINSFGLSEIDGIVNYINYPLYTSTPNYETFYYTEAEYSNNQPALLWYTRIDPTNVNAAMLSKLAHENEQYNIQSLLYYTPGLFDKVNPSSIEQKDMLLEDHELATFRSSFGDEMAVFTGLKGVDSHSGAYTHKNLDSGTFELYALGERFIGNYSNETYNVVVPDGYWDYDYGRWTYYKKNVQGQNTLVFNPEKNPVLMQDPYEKAPITRFESNNNSGLATIDLSRVYKKDALSVQRGLKLFNNRQDVLVQDEFKLRDYSTMYWSAHTEARIDMISDKIVRLTLNGKSLYAIITSELGTWDYMPATALPGTIGDFCNLDNEGVNKLIIKLENVLEGTLSVMFVTSLEEITDFGTNAVVPLSEWALDTETPVVDAKVENITIDAEFGDKYKYRFNPNQYEYVVKLAYGINEVPNLNVTYDEAKYEVNVVKAPIFNDITKVIVKNKETGLEKTYKFKFIVDVMTKDYENFKEIDIANITGSAGVDKLIDGNTKTSFTSFKKEEVILELNELSTITNVLIRFNGGLINTYYFDIFYSEDGVTYKSCYNAGQNSKNIGDEVYTIGNIDAKFIKIVFNGNIKDDKLALSEIKLLNNGFVPEAGDNANNKPAGLGLGAILGITGGVVAAVAIAAVVTVVVIKKKKKPTTEE